MTADFHYVGNFIFNISRIQLIKVGGGGGETAYAVFNRTSVFVVEIGARVLESFDVRGVFPFA